MNRIIAILLFILLLPIIIFASLYIFIVDGFPIIFSQKRAGIDNSYFNIYKLRTMKKNTPDIATDKLTFDPFIFGGKILRKLSLDELPQLLNIIKGDINFIGPRPALYNQNELINKRKKLGISKIKPGITGWAQVNGRDNISEEEKIKFDFYYLENKSIKLNFKIIYKTFLRVLTAKDVN
jgi:O-antigen biosynthesis protein WbqP